MRIAESSSNDPGLVSSSPAVWTAVPLGNIHRNETGNEVNYDDSFKVPQFTSVRSNFDRFVLCLLLKMNVWPIIFIFMMIYLAVSVNVLVEPSTATWWLRTFLGLFIVMLQVSTLRKVSCRNLLSPYHMTQKTVYVLSSMAGILLGIWTSDPHRYPWFAPVYYDMNACFFVVLAMMTLSRATSLQDGVPNALFSSASSNKAWVRAILWIHPCLILNTFVLASLSDQGQAAMNKPFFWLAGWPILFMSHIWRKQVSLRLHVRADAAVVVDTTTQRLVFDQVKLAYEAPLDNDMHPEYFENIFDADSSRCVIVERRNGSKHFVVCPEDPREFIRAVMLAVEMCGSQDQEAPPFHEATPQMEEQHATAVRLRKQ